jgi:hypothetical protein
VVLRFSRQAPTLRDDSLYFVDGACLAEDRAVYVPCPGASIGDGVVEPEFIEVRINNSTWLPISDYVARRRAARAKRKVKAKSKEAESVSVSPAPLQQRPMSHNWLRKLLNLVSRGFQT